MTRVPLEPTECFVTVKVRHVTMGKQERRFPSSSAMSSVFDWIGSLCEEPENFTLRDALALPLHPSNPIVDRTMIYMVFSDKKIEKKVRKKVEKKIGKKDGTRAKLKGIFKIESVI